MSILSLTTFKQYAGIDYDERDTAIQMVIDGVEEWIGKQTGKPFTQVSRIEYLDGGGKALWPKTLPIVSITEIYDVEAAAVEDADNYVIQGDGIYRTDDDRWDADRRARWRVTLVSGYSATTLPAGLTMLCYQLASRCVGNTDDKSSVSAAGYSMNFQAFMDGDMWSKLKQYKGRGGGIIG